VKSDSFKDFVVDQLGALPGLLVNPMFGGYGLYLGEIFFGILAYDKLYFKTSDETRDEYLSFGAKPFVYEKRDPNKAGKGKKKKVSLNQYFEVPVEVLEDSRRLQEWAGRAAEAAEKIKRKKVK